MDTMGSGLESHPDKNGRWHRATVSTRPRTVAGSRSPRAVQRRKMFTVLEAHPRQPRSRPATRVPGPRPNSNRITRPKTTYDFRVERMRSRKPIIEERKPIIEERKRIEVHAPTAVSRPKSIEDVAEEAVTEYVLNDMSKLMPCTRPVKSKYSRHGAMKTLVDDFVESYKMKEAPDQQLNLVTLESVILLRRLLSSNRGHPSHLVARLAMDLIRQLSELETPYQTALQTVFEAVEASVYDLNQRDSSKTEFKRPSQHNAYFQTAANTKKRLQEIQEKLSSLQQELDPKNNVRAIQRNIDRLTSREEKMNIIDHCLEALVKKKGTENSVEDSIESLCSKVAQNYLSLETQSKLTHDMLVHMNNSHSASIPSDVFKGMLEHMEPKDRAKLVCDLTYNTIERTKEELRAELQEQFSIVSDDAKDITIDAFLRENRQLIFKNLTTEDKEAIFNSTTDHQKRKFIHYTIQKKPQLIKGSDFPGRLDLLPGEEPVSAIATLLNLVQPKRRITALGDSVLRLPRKSTHQTLAFVLNSMFEDKEDATEDVDHDDEIRASRGQLMLEGLPSGLRWNLLDGLLQLYQEELVLRQLNEENGTEGLTSFIDKSATESKEDIQKHIVDSVTKMFVALPSSTRERMIGKFQHAHERLLQEE